MSEYIKQLNEVQYNAATKYDGPSLVIAGAGSGKTRVLTCRIAYMISQGVDPSSILALTFTNKAAREMKERMGTVVDKSPLRKMSMGTFHSVFSRILKEEAEHIGFPNTFTIYETADSRNLVKTIIKEMNLNDEKYKPKDIFSRISLMKNSLTTPTIYENNSTHVSDDIKAGRSEFATIYKMYMKRCKMNGAMDFDDLLLYTNILFKNHPEVLAKYQERYKYILVDEYQDTNFSQYLIIKKIAEQYKNICVVGDDAQSIYSFRGAKIENILRFQNDYPSATVHKLEQNYRSTQNIVGAANSVISKNSNQLKKNVFSKNEEGDLITLLRSEGDREEASNICKDIAYRNSLGVDYSDIAILYRANSQSKAFEDQLRMRQIPYRIYGGQSFYQRAEIKNIIAYVRLVVNINDDEALKRVINFPARGIGNTTINKVVAKSTEMEKSMWEVISTCSPSDLGINSGTAKKLNDFYNLIQYFNEKKDSVDIYEFVFELLTKSGILANYRDNHAPESQSAYENVEELVNSLKAQVEEHNKDEDNEEILDVESWIQDVALLTDMDEKDETGEQKKEVVLMTIHAAKGLEYNTVYVVGVEEGGFPSQRSAEDLNGLEEERRLFYVALTRAVKKLTISFATSRYKWGNVTPTMPSRFIKEIEGKYLDDTDLLSMGSYEVPSISLNKNSEYNSWQKKDTSSKVYKTNSDSSTGTNSVEMFQKKNLKKISANSTSSAPSAPIDLVEGDSVSHARFGKGKIEVIEPFNGDYKITVDFVGVGKKTLLRKFANLEKQ